MSMSDLCTCGDPRYVHVDKIYRCADCGSCELFEIVPPGRVLPDYSNGKLFTGREFYERLAKHLNSYAWTQDEKDTILQATFEVAEGLDNA